MLVVDIIRCRPLYALRSVVLDSLPRSICVDMYLFERVHIQTETENPQDRVARCLLLHLPYHRIPRRELWLILRFCSFAVGQLIELHRLHHVFLHLSRLHVIHERVVVCE